MSWTTWIGMSRREKLCGCWSSFSIESAWSILTKERRALGSAALCAMAVMPACHFCRVQRLQPGPDHHGHAFRLFGIPAEAISARPGTGGLGACRGASSGQVAGPKGPGRYLDGRQRAGPGSPPWPCIWRLALVRRHQQKVLLVDQHPALGDVALCLGMGRHQYSFYELVHNMDRLDAGLAARFPVAAPQRTASAGLPAGHPVLQ